MRTAIPAAKPNCLGRRAIKKTQLMKIGVFRNNRKAVLAGVVPDLAVARNSKSGGPDMLRTGKQVCEDGDKAARQILVEQEFQVMPRQEGGARGQPRKRGRRGCPRPSVPGNRR